MNNNLGPIISGPSHPPEIFPNASEPINDNPFAGFPTLNRSL